MHGNPGGGLRIESWQVAGADRRPKWAKRQRPNCLRGSEKDPLSSLLGWHILGLTYRRVSTEWLRGAHDTDGGTPVVGPTVPTVHPLPRRDGVDVFWRRGGVAWVALLT